MNYSTSINLGKAAGSINVLVFLARCLALFLLFAAQAVIQNANAAINTQIEPSRVSGVAPLAVFFDATSTTSTATSRPFHELHYAWNFGDFNAGSWQYGNPDSINKNNAYGPVAAHVFETPGIYTVNLDTKGLKGDTGNKTISINVQDPNVVFPGADTICFSSSGDFSGCPADAKTVTTSSFQKVARYIQSNKRLLLRKGETWDSSMRTNISTNGPGLITSFGSGGLRPKIKNSGPFSTFRIGYQVQNWRIAGFDFEGGGGDAILEIYGEAQDVLFMDNSGKDSFDRAVIANNALFRRNKWDIPQRIFIADNDFRLYSAHVMFIAAGKLAIQGNYLDDTNSNRGEHVVRITHVEQSVITHNYLAHPLHNKKATLTLRNAQRELVCPYCGRDTRDVVISDNDFYASGDNTLTIVDAQGHAYTAQGTNIIIERNFFSQATDTPGKAQMAVNVKNVKGVSIRNNIIYMNNWKTYRSIELKPSASDVDVFNNACYASDNPSLRVRCIHNRGASNIRVSNNILYAPNHTGITRVIDGLENDGSNITALANPYIAEKIDSPQGFRVVPGNAAYDVGIAVPVFMDFTNKVRFGTAGISVGAYENN